jgi:hypothetical protein
MLHLSHYSINTDEQSRVGKKKYDIREKEESQHTSPTPHIHYMLKNCASIMIN